MTVEQQPEAGLTLTDISVRFDGVTAVSRANLAIRPGEFFTLLGPSGCGKTTLLRTLAGFNRQAEGTIRLGGTILDDTPAYGRDVGMVFQNYAVFPHLNVWDNVAYGLKSRKVSGAELEQRVIESLSMVDLLGYEKRMPKQLSGGQQQRVVIARAIAIRPRILLMDEPLANLDARLRLRLRADLKALQRNLGITTIYVTHDQEEALSLSDRIAVMSEGRVLHVGTPREIYDTPATLKVAQFIGEGTFLRGNAEARGPGAAIVLEGGRRIEASNYGSERRGDVWVGFRPQDVALEPGEAGGGLPGVIATKSFIGSYVNFDIDCGFAQPVKAQIHARMPAAGLEQGAVVSVRIPADCTMVFSGEEEDGEL
ncbi:ABC-type Fe3+/spermidine/putrescine transport system ATPase subunit [Aquamicrobium terrae]